MKHKKMGEEVRKKMESRLELLERMYAANKDGWAEEEDEEEGKPG